jgi:hypothetical protein
MSVAFQAQLKINIIIITQYGMLQLTKCNIATIRLNNWNCVPISTSTGNDVANHLLLLLQMACQKTLRLQEPLRSMKLQTKPTSHCKNKYKIYQLERVPSNNPMSWPPATHMQF